MDLLWRSLGAHGLRRTTHDIERRDKVRQDAVSDNGQRDAARPPLEQLGSDFGFQGLDVRCDGARRYAKFPGGSDEALEARRSLECPKGIEWQTSVVWWRNGHLTQIFLG